MGRSTDSGLTDRPARVRVGVVGIGFGQAVLVPAFRTDAQCEVVAIAASSEARARRVADRLGIATALGDWQALVSESSVDAVAIALPPPLQPAVVRAAVRSGKHVFCEKPAAMTVVDARSMRDAAEEAGVVHAIDFEFPESASWAELRACHAAGRLGTISRIYIDWRIRGRSSDPDDRAAWKSNDREGGGLWGGFLPHALYHLEWIGGPLARVVSRRTADARAFQLWADFVSGATAAVTLDAGTVAGSGQRIEVIGSAGSAVLENESSDHAGPFALSIDRTPVCTDPESASGDRRVDAVARVARRFLDAIRHHGEVRPDLRDGFRVQELLDAASRSEQGRVWVPV